MAACLTYHRVLAEAPPVWPQPPALRASRRNHNGQAFFRVLHVLRAFLEIGGGGMLPTTRKRFLDRPREPLFGFR